MIDSKAVVHPDAQIADDVTVGAYSVIGADVAIDSGTIVGPQVVIEGPTKIGKNNHIYQFASIGAAPQDKKYAGEATLLEIGDHNIFREFTSINRGTVQGGGVTKIGHHNLLMSYVHVAHDCIIQNYTVLSGYAGLAGHVIIEDWAILGGYAAVHQYCTIGAHAIVGNSCRITQDVLPYLMIAGGENPKPYGLNNVGLRRRHFDDTMLSGLKKAYRAIFRQNLNTEETLAELTALQREYPQVDLFIDAIKKSTRGFLK